MALITPFEGDERADRILSVAETHYQDALVALEELTRELRSGGTVAPGDVQRAAREYRSAVQTLFDERKRLEKQRKEHAGIAGEFALDLNSARAEVGGLLDRLRAARGAGPVSE